MKSTEGVKNRGEKRKGILWLRDRNESTNRNENHCINIANSIRIDLLHGIKTAEFSLAFIRFYSIEDCPIRVICHRLYVYVVMENRDLRYNLVSRR